MLIKYNLAKVISEKQEYRQNHCNEITYTVIFIIDIL